MSFKSLAKDAMIIGITQVLVNLANFLLLPTTTKTLGTDGYGLWAQVLVTISLVSTVTMQGQNMTLLRFLKVRDGKKNLSIQFFTSLCLVAIVSIIISLIIILLSQPLANMILSSGDLYFIIIAAAILIIFTALSEITNSYFRAVGMIKTYAALNIFNAFGGLVAILAFVINGYGVLGAVLGSLAVNIVTFGIRLFMIVRQVGVSRPDWSLLRRNLQFGLPLVPNNLIRWITTSSDRYLVALMLGLSVAGIYSAAYGVGGMIFMLIAPIQMILYPALSKLFDDNKIEDVKQHLRGSSRYYMMLAVPAVTGMSILSTPLLEMMTTAEYAPAAAVIPFIAVAGLLSGMFKFVENITHLVKKTHLNLITFGIPALVDVSLVIVLTPTVGIVGTAFATTAAYAVMLIIGVYISRMFLQFSLDWSFASKAVVASLLMALAIFLLQPTGTMDLFISIAVGVPIYFAALYAFKGFNRMEIETAKALLNRATGRGDRARTRPLDKGRESK